MRGYFRQNHRALIAENGLNSDGLTGRYVGAVMSVQLALCKHEVRVTMIRC